MRLAKVFAPSTALMPCIVATAFLSADSRSVAAEQELQDPHQHQDEAGSSSISSGHPLAAYEPAYAEFVRTEIAEVIVYFWQRRVGEAIVEGDFKAYYFDKVTSDLIDTKVIWRDGLPETLPEVITRSQAESLVPGQIRFARLFYIAPDSHVFPLDAPTQNPCWVVESLHEGHVTVTVVDAVEGRVLGPGIPPPYTAVSLTGPVDLNGCSGDWGDWYQNAADWFDTMGYLTEAIQWPGEADIQGHVQSDDTAMFYEAAHGGSWSFSNACDDDTDAYEIESWIADYFKMPFVFLGSCDGMCYTGDDSLSYEFRKGSSEGAVTVGYCGMSGPTCESDCWYAGHSISWQDSLFEQMNAGETVRAAFDQANLDYPGCGAHGCMRFAGDEEFAVVPLVTRFPDCNTNGVPDDTDIGAGTSQDCNDNGVPDECEEQCSEQAKLTASDGEAGDQFACSVGIFEGTAVVGAPYDNDNGTGAGSAYVFRFDGSAWVQEAKLLASDGAADDHLGYDVAIAGDTVLISAWQDDDNGWNAGAAYVFRFDGSSWNEEAKLLASDGAMMHNFGTSVSIFGDAALISAPCHEPIGTDGCESAVGAAYVFRYDGSSWIEEEMLQPSWEWLGDAFGNSVAISHDTAVIGAKLGSKAYVFRYDGSNWIEEAALGGGYDEFGASVGIFGGTVVVGASYDSESGTGAGAAYALRFDGSSWVQEAKLLASDGAMRDRFGDSVAIYGHTAVIGAYDDDDSGLRSGSAYVFRFDGSSWIEEAKLLASDGASGDFFGDSVAASSGIAVIAAPYDDDGGATSGSAYVFRHLYSRSPGDSDCNGDVDLVDFASCVPCLTGPYLGPYGVGCETYDFDFDRDVDLRDFAGFQAAFSGDNS